VKPRLPQITARRRVLERTQEQIVSTRRGDASTADAMEMCAKNVEGWRQ
jgi:hypothetical protein